jgi:GNAT superfamily N-acetyltransferase
MIEKYTTERSKEENTSIGLDSLRIQTLAQENISDWLVFMRSNLSTWPQFNSLWKWRQDGVPQSGGENATVFFVGDKITGGVGVVPSIFTYQGRRIHVSWQQDSLVLKAMRGKGVGKKLVSAAAKPYELILAKGTSNAMYGLRKALGYLDVPLSDYMLNILHPTFKIRAPTRSVLEIALYLWQIALPVPFKRAKTNIKAISAFDTIYDDLSARMSREALICPLKSSAYLNWRYFQCPVKSYTVLQASNSQSCAAIVLGTSISKQTDGWIVDLLCMPQDKAIAFQLISEARRFFKRQRIKRIWTFATSPTARRWLMRYGFMPTGQSPRFTFLQRGEEVSREILSSRCWNVWHGDGDIDLYL